MTGSKDIWLRGGLDDPDDVALRPDGPDTPVAHKRGGGFATAIGGGVKTVTIDKTGGGVATAVGGADDYSIQPTPPIEPVVPSGGMPVSPTPRRRRRRVVRVYSRLRVHSTYVRRVRVRRVPTPRPDRVPVAHAGRVRRASGSSAQVETGVRISAQAHAISPTLTHTEMAVARIPEGPETEAVLLLLGVL